MNEALADVSILWPALVAGVLVLLSHVPLGQQVLKRGIVFIDLAIAQVAGLGVIAATATGMELQGWETQVAAVVAALLGALLLTWTERKAPEQQEALTSILTGSAGGPMERFAPLVGTFAGVETGAIQLKCCSTVAGSALRP